MTRASAMTTVMRVLSPQLTSPSDALTSRSSSTTAANCSISRSHTCRVCSVSLRLDSQSHPWQCGSQSYQCHCSLFPTYRPPLFVYFSIARSFYIRSLLNNKVLDIKGQNSSVGAEVCAHLYQVTSRSRHTTSGSYVAVYVLTSGRIKWQ